MLLVVAKLCDIRKRITIPDISAVGNFETDADAEGNNEWCCLSITVYLQAREKENCCLKTSPVSLFAFIFLIRTLSDILLTVSVYLHVSRKPVRHCAALTCQKRKSAEVNKSMTYVFVMEENCCVESRSPEKVDCKALIESAVGFSVAVERCPLCSESRRPFYCSSCVNNGHFIHSNSRYLQR